MGGKRVVDVKLDADTGSFIPALKLGKGMIGFQAHTGAARNALEPPTDGRYRRDGSRCVILAGARLLLTGLAHRLDEAGEPRATDRH
jgi:hypothetical protein